MLHFNHASTPPDDAERVSDRSGFSHFMLKEIFEQPDAVASALAGRIDKASPHVELDGVKLRDSELASLSRVIFVACGTSWHAALLGKYVFEEWARLPGEAEVASELRHRHPLHDEGALAVPVSQSGETFDTLMAARMLKEQTTRTVAISNAADSSLARESDGVIDTRAGSEIGVAATKTFTTQIAAVMLLALKVARARGAVDNLFSAAVINGLLSVPALIEQTLEQGKAIHAVAERLAERNDFLYVGRGLHYPMALEGALKAKEVSYVHAEGYPAGEMKYGPIALIGSGTPVLCIAPSGPTLAYMKRNIQDVKTSGGFVIAIITEGDDVTRGLADIPIPIPRAAYWLQPFLVAIPLQLLAYHLAVLRGTDVDRPRNRVKRVTADR